MTLLQIPIRIRCSITPTGSLENKPNNRAGSFERSKDIYPDTLALNARRF
jgi:hypothetical protein